MIEDTSWLMSMRDIFGPLVVIKMSSYNANASTESGNPFIRLRQFGCDPFRSQMQTVLSEEDVIK